MENVVPTLQNFPWENVSFADLKWITGKTNIVWGWFVWEQGIAACRPDHNILLWKNQELRQSPNLGRADGVPIGSTGPGFAFSISQGPKSPTNQLDNGINSRSVRAEVLSVGGMEILGNTESTLPCWRCCLRGKHEKNRYNLSIFFASAKWGATFWLGLEKPVIWSISATIIRETSCYLGMAWAELGFSKPWPRARVCCNQKL